MPRWHIAKIPRFGIPTRFIKDLEALPPTMIKEPSFPGDKTNARAPPIGGATAARHECAWLVDGETHGARGSAERRLLCHWNAEHATSKASHLGLKNRCDDWKHHPKQ
ncbi:hypothetical protein BS17DRAFT_881186 [Gyrodon lividus]|nr:hypothetical protein BS17DRAFT_881186 [Gyrodon lividus]